jgi:hypothetical protein
MSRVTSRDGTPISFNRIGRGPAVILVNGGLADRSENAPLAAELAERFTVYNYDRRGRGGSGDTLPYAVDREVEDIAALLPEAGGTAHLYGPSAGGGLVLKAAAAGLPIDRLAVYDVPYCVTSDAAQRARTFVDRLGSALADGCAGDALELFMWFAGSTQEDITGARQSPMWPGLLAIEHTIGYDAACMGDYQPPVSVLSKITRPTLAITGDVLDTHMTGLPSDLFERAAEAIIRNVPDAKRHRLPGQTHMVEASALAPVLARFFKGLNCHP